MVYQDNRLSSRECFPSIVVKKELFKKREKSLTICYEFQENTTKKKCTQNQVENTKKKSGKGTGLGSKSSGGSKNQDSTEDHTFETN